MRKAVDFYRTRVSTGGGYHFQYAEDLSYGRSEMSEGPTRVEVQREGTPLVGMAYLNAYHATRDSYYLEAAREVARALVLGQYCSGGWDYFIELDPQRRSQHPYRADGACAEGAPARPERRTTLDDNVTQAALRLLMRVDRDLGFKDEQIHEAALFALDSLVKAQYPNGAWPNRFMPKASPCRTMDTSDDQCYRVSMKQIAAAKFKEQCLSLLDTVDQDGIVITKRGRPVAKLIPFASDSASLIGSLKGKLKLKGNLLSTGVKWDAER